MILLLALLAAAETAPVTDEIRWARVAAGTFQMGCVPKDTHCEAGEKPRHAVTLSHDFWMMKTDVTVAAYKAFAKATTRAMPKTPEFNPTWALEDHPIVHVTWDDATAYCAWAEGRLPTE